MFGSRDDIRKVYFDVWQKLKDNNLVLEPMETIVADVIKLHPEYHNMLDDTASLEKDYTPDGGKTNPFLHMGMHIAIREQISNNRPIGIKSLYMKRCKTHKMHDIEHNMMECLAETMWNAQRNNQDLMSLTIWNASKKTKVS